MSKYICWRCGIEHDMVIEPQERVFCEACMEEHRKEYKAVVEKYTKLKTRVMYETALRIMEKAGVYMHDYIEAAYVVWDKIKKGEASYYSSHEIITAIVLEGLLYEYFPNYPIDRYIVDFYVPELKVCVEVDGDRHKGRELYDSKRDIKIRSILGSEWEIVRIPTKYIEQNPPRIVDAIIAIRDKKKELRAKNHGILPDHYSRREREHYRNILGYRTKRVRKA